MAIPYLTAKFKSPILFNMSFGAKLPNLITALYGLQIHMEKLSQQAPELQELQENASGLLTDNLCDKHEPVRTLRKQCEQLEPRWEKLQKKIDNSLQQLENRVSGWSQWVWFVILGGCMVE